MQILANGTLIDIYIYKKLKYMNLESPKVTLNKSPQETFDFLSDIKNFEQLMPENISKFEVLGDDKFLFALKGMPEIILQKNEAIAPNKIVLGASGGKLDFSLTGNITEIDANTSEVQLTFDGEFNAMMAMMIKGPISKFIETLATNMTTAV
jgi:carbon monoxide dehydrogenase subunit G